MKYEISTLPNNLRVVTAEMPGAMSATISVSVGVGSRHEDYDANGGISHFLEHLLFKGTAKRPSTKIISEQIDAVGGYNNAYTSNEVTNFYIKVPYQQLELGIDILGDMLQNSLFDAAEIDRERGVVLEEMNVYRDDPGTDVHNIPPKLFWPNHPMSHSALGKEDIIRTVKRDVIDAYHKKHYRPGNMVVGVAGRIKHQAVVEQVQKYFGDMKDHKQDPIINVKQTLNGPIAEAITKETAQTHVVIGTVAYPDLHPNEAAGRLITTILGRGLSSRLFLNVRERQGLAYTVNASNESFVDTGAFEVYAGVNLAKTSDAIRAIIEELHRVATEPVSEAELNKAKNQMRGSLQMAMESNSSVADRISNELLLLQKVQTVEEIMERLDAVTPDDILRVGAEMLDLKRLRLGIISPDPMPAVKAFEQLINS
jgi:predicted Zn-dependent peptidase